MDRIVSVAVFSIISVGSDGVVLDGHTFAPPDEGHMTTKMLRSLWAHKSFTPPEEATWHDLMAQLAGRARGGPCDADVVANAWCSGVGFGSRLDNMVYEVLLAMMGGYSLSYCSGPDGFATSVWAPRFRNQFNVSLCPSAQTGCTDRAHSFKQQVGILIAAGLPEDYMLRLKRFITKQFFQYSDGTRKLLDNSMKEFGIASKQYLGVHIRYGDKFKEVTPLPPPKYADEAIKHLNNESASQRGGDQVNSDTAHTLAVVAGTIVQELRERRMNTVYLATDDNHVEDQLRTLLGGGVRIVKNGRTTHVDDRKYTEDDTGVQALLEDIEALRNAAVFIGTSTSNLGRLVYFLREEHQRSITLDGGSKGWAAIHVKRHR